MKTNRIIFMEHSLKKPFISKKYFMDRKIITLILSLAILSSFFMPLFEWHSFEMSGLNYILSTHIPPYKYFLILIPFSVLFLFYGTLNEENYFFNRKLLSRLPLLTLIFIFIMRYITGDSGNGFSDNSNVFSGIDLGFWLTLGFSGLLVFTKGEMKAQYSENEWEFFE
jgi:hypothetical protein